jgi:hypothetical protein
MVALYTPLFHMWQVYYHYVLRRGVFDSNGSLICSIIKGSIDLIGIKYYCLAQMGSDPLFLGAAQAERSFIRFEILVKRRENACYPQ